MFTSILGAFVMFGEVFSWPMAAYIWGLRAKKMGKKDAFLFAVSRGILFGVLCFIISGGIATACKDIRYLDIVFVIVWISLPFVLLGIGLRFYKQRNAQERD